MRLIDIINEITVSPERAWKLKNWAIASLDEDYDDLEEELGQDKADAIFVASMITKDKRTIKYSDIDKFTSDKKWSNDEVINFLKLYNII